MCVYNNFHIDATSNSTLLAQTYAIFKRNWLRNKQCVMNIICLKLFLRLWRCMGRVCIFILLHLINKRKTYNRWLQWWPQFAVHYANSTNNHNHEKITINEVIKKGQRRAPRCNATDEQHKKPRCSALLLCVHFILLYPRNNRTEFPHPELMTIFNWRELFFPRALCEGNSLMEHFHTTSVPIWWVFIAPVTVLILAQTFCAVDRSWHCFPCTVLAESITRARQTGTMLTSANCKLVELLANFLQRQHINYPLPRMTFHAGGHTRGVAISVCVLQQIRCLVHGTIQQQRQNSPKSLKISLKRWHLVHNI